MVELLTKRFPRVEKVDVRLPILPILDQRLVVEAFVAKKLVVVALVLVASKRVRVWNVVDPLTKRLVNVPVPPLTMFENKLVVDAFVAKKLVVVAEVPVALVQLRMEKSPVPVKLPLAVMLVKVPPSLMRAMTETRASTSDVLCLVTVGRVSSTNISSRRIVVGNVGPEVYMVTGSEP